MPRWASDGNKKYSRKGIGLILDDRDTKGAQDSVGF